jgi:threonine/homoserine/homoserine lactone efflux protein
MLSLSTLYFPAGLAIGFGAAAPVGPVNLLVIQRSLCGQRRAARAMGAGAALGDALFAIVAGFGLGAIGTFISDYDALIRILGGVVLLVFAVAIWRSAPHLDTRRDAGGRQKLALLGFSMAATNPATLLFFIGSFSAMGFIGLGHATMAEWLHASLLVIGVFLGSMLWWMIVTGIARRLRDRVTDRHLHLLNHGTAAALALFGIGAAAIGAAAL